jgi:hypothetical protein
MHLLKSVVLAGLLTGVATTAFAQSVATLPPTTPATAAATTAPAVSNARMLPDPGSSGAWKVEHHQAQQSDNDPAQHPYTAPHFGPAPN